MRYFIYCRKSTEAEDRQVLSIDSQEGEIVRAFGAGLGFEIAEVLKESYSAKSPGRPIFDAMLRRIERGEADGIIAWHPDRLARNSIDGGRIIYLLDRKKLRDLKFSTFTFENNSQGKFMLSIMFGQSKYYSDALSENVKRGNRTKLERGWRPNHAPLGYRNDKESRTIVPDPERFPLIKRMFRMALGGTPVRTICETARNEWGLRTPQRKRIGGKPIALSSTYKVLSNPFYAGLIRWNGLTYQGAHKPIVSLAEFDEVQRLLHKGDKQKPKTKHFPFTGFIRCGECACLVTAEHKVNRYGSHYTYYHCTKRKFDYRCRQPSVRARDLEQQVAGFIGRLTIPDSIHAWAIAQGQSSLEDQARLKAENEAKLQKAIHATESALQSAVSLRVRNSITEEEFQRERTSLQEQLLRLQQAIKHAATGNAFEPWEALVSFGSRAAEWFTRSDDARKRKLLRIVGSNPMLLDKKLNIQAAKPFSIGEILDQFPNQRGAVEDIRTLWAARDPELVRTLNDIVAFVKEMESLPAEDSPPRPKEA
jgi:site-specific DNA recombinase